MAKIRTRMKTSKMIELRERYDELILEMTSLNNNHALDYYKIVKEASEIGFEIFGVNFSQQKLSVDFGISRKSVGRCLALNNMNKKTQKLVETGKISASKILPILFNSNQDYQNEIIQKIMKDNITQEQIVQNMPIFESKEEVENWNYRNPMSKLSTKSSNNLNIMIYRRITELTFLLDADTNRMENKDIVVQRIKDLQEKLDYFVNKLNGIYKDDESEDLLEDIESVL